MKYLIIYLIVINAVGFILMLVDKFKAKRNHWRIPEKTLLGVAAIGGSIGSLAGMYLVRHKTKHPRFFIGIPVMLVLQAAMVIWLYSRFSS